MRSPDKKNNRNLAALKIDPELKEPVKNKKPFIWIAAAFVLLITIWVLGAMLKDRPVEVETVVARRYQAGQGMTVLNASGYIEPRRRATIAAKITGRVKEMLVEEGQAVTKGQVLARLDSADTKARFNSAKAELGVTLARIPELDVGLKDAERNLSRISELFKRDVASRKDLDKAEIAVERVKAQLARSREEVRASEARLKVAGQALENCTIRSPFAGTVVSKDAQVGEMVSPVSAGGGYTRTGIATIVDMDSLEIEVDVNESYIAGVTVGQKVMAALDAYPQGKIPASVRTVIPTADRQKATVKVRIAFDKLDPRILPDMGVKVAFMDKDNPSQSSVAVLVVPKTAIRDIDEKPVVFILKENFIERRAVKPGRTVGDSVEILAGISDGEHVVISGPEDLQDGQEVVVK
jgi:RND family efflux transporter MFP subunit